ncbi:MAG TPA: hypothetical protein VFG50_11220, partial [Rhodothermales bacterium]|nr:hypothetical protein [Rhodothermales bacterium]
MRAAGWLVPLAVGLVFVAGCAGPRAVVTAPPVMTPIPAEPAADTTLGAAPRDVIPPPSFLQAVQEGTRTADGLPGPKYWTNTAEYTLKARV